MQRFIVAQGTTIALAHPNQHKDADGKNVHGGTSDIRNSFSQSAMIEILVDPPEDQPGERQIKIKNDKLRGMAKCSNVYSYAHGDGKNWIERADTVRNVEEKEAQANVDQFLANSQRKQDQPIIEWIADFLKTGAKATRDIQLASGDDVPGSRSDRSRVLKAYCGELWDESKGQCGGTNYYLIDWKPAPKVTTKPWMQ